MRIEYALEVHINFSFKHPLKEACPVAGDKLLLMFPGRKLHTINELNFFSPVLIRKGNCGTLADGELAVWGLSWSNRETDTAN